VFEQEEGYWVGALTLNTIVSLHLVALLMGAAVIATWPDIPTYPLMAFGIASMLLFPLFFYPFSKTLWVAIDLLFFHPERMEPGTGQRAVR